MTDQLSEPSQLLSQARESAFAVIPEWVQGTAIFRSMEAWPAEQSSVHFDLDSLGRHLDVYGVGVGSGGGCPDVVLEYIETHRADDWRRDRAKIAERFALDLLHQCGRFPDMFRSQVTNAIKNELELIDLRRGPTE